MKKFIKIALVLLLIGVIGAGLGYKFIYNKPHRDFEKAKADFSLTCNEAFDAYLGNRSEADEKFTGKVLEIEGVLTSIETPDTLTVLVFALNEGLFGDEGIRVTMLPKYSEKVKELVPGTSVKIKGFCSGYNETDVILEKGSIIN